MLIKLQPDLWCLVRTFSKAVRDWPGDDKDIIKVVLEWIQSSCSAVLCFQTCTEVMWDLPYIINRCYNKDILISKMLCIFRAPLEAKQLRYMMWTWACFLVKCSTIKRKITILSNLLKITYWRAWLHPCKASGMNFYLEHVFTARPDAKERIPASFDAISALVDVAVALGTEQPVLVLCWEREGGESVANDQEQASARCLFSFFPS